MSDPIIEEGRRDDPVSPERRRREPVFNLAAAVIVIIGICFAVQIIQSYVLDPQQDFALMLHGAFIPARYSGRYALNIYAFTSPITYAFLHGGWLHLIINMVWLAAFGSPLANRIGSGRFFFFWIVAALVAALAHYVTHPGDVMPVVGASGAISGMMGAASRFGFYIERVNGMPAFAGRRLSVAQALSSRAVVAFLAVWFIVNLVAGMGYLSPGINNPIAWQAHIGGFLAGFFGLPLFDREPRSDPE